VLIVISGPSVEFDLSAQSPQDFKLGLDCAVGILNQQAHAYIHLQPNKLVADIGIRFLVWSVVLRCSASVLEAGQVGGFDFYLRFEDNTVGEVNRLLPGLLDVAQRAAIGLLQQAEQEVASWRSASDHLKTLIEVRKAEVRKGQDELLARVHDAVASVEAAKANLNGLRRLVDEAQHEYDDHSSWYWWLCGVAEYYAGKLAVLWVAYHTAEAVLDLAVLVLQVRAVILFRWCSPLCCISRLTLALWCVRAGFWRASQHSPVG